MAALAGERKVRDEEFFDGLRQEKHQLQERLASRYGPAAREQFASAETAMAGWDRTDYDRAAEQGRELLGQMSMARSRGVRAEEPEALDLVAEHYRQVRAVWPADARSYRGLADLIEQDPQQHGMVAEADPDLPHWLASAIRAYVAQRRPKLAAGAPSRSMALVIAFVYATTAAFHGHRPENRHQRVRYRRVLAQVRSAEHARVVPHLRVHTREVEGETRLVCHVF